MMRGNGWSRGADEFHALVSGKGEPGDRADLLELVAALRAVPAPTARPEFVTSLRTQLVAAAEREPARVEDDLAARLTPRQRRGSRERRLAAVVGGFAVVSATGSMAMAAQDALPGDVLYPIKRAIENAQTNLQSDGAGKADTLISHAEARLSEVQELTARDADADAVSETLQDFTDQAEQASEFALDDYATSGNEDAIAHVRSFAADSMDLLGALGPLVPEDSRSMLITATQTVRQIDLAAFELCPVCADGDVTQLPDFATQALSSVLDVDLPSAASVTNPGRPTGPAPSSRPTKGGSAPAAEESEPPASPVETVTDIPGSDPTTVIDKTVDKVKDTVKGAVDGVTGNGGDAGEETVIGGLTGGVAGLLNGLLGGS
ncbi:hypothetical protein E9934_11325 [Nocardioides caeni]|uniref:DUF5667 domain-containing protein n=2 Tax=Nocardioides caeni TaxID=574700 RepID=A0A4V4HK38_9ACTN|nr:hypothetical protein E9934_11325 [Nocardioides caeni]